MQLKKGFLVVFEGIDGAGKTTQVKLLFDELKNRGFDVLLSKEPTDSVHGLKIKELSQEGRDFFTAEEEYKLFLLDREIHVEKVIKPALHQRKIVILDRYYFSTMAYQGARGLDPERIKRENEAFAPIPEIVFLVDIPPRVGLRRIEKGRGEEPNLFEKEENLIKVREIFNALKEAYILRLNGAEKIQRLHAIIMNVIEDVIAHYLVQDVRYSLPEGNGFIDHFSPTLRG